MARLPRLVLAGRPHLVLQHALDDRQAFADLVDRQAYLEALREAAAVEQVQLHAYALRPQEVRLLLTPSTAGGIGRLMQAVGRRYVSAYNRRHRRSGTLWNGRYRCALLDPQTACLDALLWLDGSTDEPGASSAGHHTGAQRDALLVDPPAYWALGNTPFEREASYRLRLAAGLPQAKVEALRRAARGGWAVGPDVFVRAAASESGRVARPRARGRPARKVHTT